MGRAFGTANSHKQARQGITNFLTGENRANGGREFHGSGSVFFVGLCSIGWHAAGVRAIGCQAIGVLSNFGRGVD
jgi:hypothetical protein